MPTRKIESRMVIGAVPLCTDPDHEPSRHIVLEPGMYEHTCPRCARVTLFEVPPGLRLG
jgi:hypothetical protein